MAAGGALAEGVVMGKRKRGYVRVVWPTFAVYCVRCEWRGRRTELSMLKPCPNCKQMYSIRRK